MDFTGLDLFRADFSRASLVGASFSNAFLRRASFVGADLREANLSGASLHVTISPVPISGAELPCGLGISNADPPPNFTAADLSGYESEGCEAIGGGLLDRVNFTGADLENTWIVFESLVGADFTNANLRGVVFMNVGGQEERRPQGVIGSNTICPDGVNSGTDGCDAHLVQD